MARRLRIHVPGGWYHVTSRGNGGEAIYREADDCRRFLGLVSELPGRFGTEIHAFVLMENHYHLLVRCRRADLSETLRWLQTTFSVQFNWAHRRRGHVFQGRFQSILIRDEAALDAVARYLHLNPVRLGGLGLSQPDQRRAKVMRCPDPGAVLVARRLAVLRGHRWSSWPAYAGSEAAPDWLSTDRIQGGGGGRTLKARRLALVRYTEEPIRQGRMDDPWAGVVGGAILGDAAEAEALFRRAEKNPAGQAAARRQAVARARPAWSALVQATESALGRPWTEMRERHGDWGRDALMAVATRHLGWRLVEVVRQMPEVKYAAAAQGVRRFWAQAEKRPEYAAFIRRIRKEFQ